MGGIFNSSSQTTAWAGIKGLAESTSDGNFAGKLEFLTRPNGGSNTVQLSIASTGAATFTSSVEATGVNAFGGNGTVSAGSDGE